jgi:hypothetical protein
MNRQIITVVILTTVTVFGIACFNSCCIGLGCTGGYSFNDTALFTAPKSNVQIVVSSIGYVPNGADLGSGKAYVKFFATDNRFDTIFMKTSPENIDTIFHSGKPVPFSCSQMEQGKFYEFLKSIGLTRLDSNEISELRDAMTFINYGHKAGFVQGQTKYIVVGKHTKHISDD